MRGMAWILISDIDKSLLCGSTHDSQLSIRVELCDCCEGSPTIIHFIDLCLVTSVVLCSLAGILSYMCAAKKSTALDFVTASNYTYVDSKWIILFFMWHSDTCDRPDQGVELGVTTWYFIIMSPELLPRLFLHRSHLLLPVVINWHISMDKAFMCSFTAEHDCDIRRCCFVPDLILVNKLQLWGRWLAYQIKSLLGSFATHDIITGDKSWTGFVTQFFRRIWYFSMMCW